MSQPPGKRSRGLGSLLRKGSQRGGGDSSSQHQQPSGSPLNPALLEKGAIAAKRLEYDAAKPYPSVVLRQLCDEQRLRRVRDEIVNNIDATFKETDLFKVLQTGDLKNMDELPEEQLAKLPELQDLRNGLYSPEFRKAVEEMTGCGSLNARTDMSANVYSRGHHLLCHDDVIGTRRVSFIVYLTEPDEPWKPEDGGGLELYPLLEGASGVPGSVPTTVILPEWNSMAMFTVVPGQSFHSVQEVFSPDKPRLSIQGWYHADEEPSHKELASLSQLKSMAVATPAEFCDMNAGTEPPSEQDLEFLSRWVNATYLKPETWSKVAAMFREENSVQLQDFLLPDIATRVVDALSLADEASKLGQGRIPEYRAGVEANDEENEWEIVGPPHMQRYLRLKQGKGETTNGDAMGDILGNLRRELFQSVACARLLGALTDLEPKAIRSEVRRFRPGLDYTVAHYGVLTDDDRLDATLCFSKDGGDDEAASWEVGEVGGYECYIAAEDDDTEGDVAVYKADEEDDGGLLNVGARANTLNLVHRDQGIMRFVKYVSFLAPSSRVDISAEYKVDAHEDEEEEESGAEA